MARTSLICLLVMATFLAPSALGLNTPADQSGSIHIFNGATTDMSFVTWVLFANNTCVNDPYYTVLPQSTSYQFPVKEDMMSIFSKYHMANSTGLYDETVLSWSTQLVMPVTCLPDCFWIVDENGFSITDSAYTPLQLVTGWNKEITSVSWGGSK